ncbi:hypothetical protein, partial [Mycoplasmopsis cynos]
MKQNDQESKNQISPNKNSQNDKTKIDHSQKDSSKNDQGTKTKQKNTNAIGENIQQFQPGVTQNSMQNVPSKPNDSTLKKQDQQVEQNTQITQPTNPQSIDQSQQKSPSNSNTNSHQIDNKPKGKTESPSTMEVNPNSSSAISNSSTQVDQAPGTDMQNQDVKKDNSVDSSSSSSTNNPSQNQSESKYRDILIWFDDKKEKSIEKFKKLVTSNDESLKLQWYKSHNGFFGIAKKGKESNNQIFKLKSEIDSKELEKFNKTKSKAKNLELEANYKDEVLIVKYKFNDKEYEQKIELKYQLPKNSAQQDTEKVQEPQLNTPHSTQKTHQSTTTDTTSNSIKDTSKTQTNKNLMNPGSSSS